MATGGAGTRRAGWRLLVGSVRPYRRGVLAGVLAGLLWTAAKVTVPKLTQKAIDNAIVSTRQPLGVWAVLILVAGVIQATFTGIRRYQAFGVSWRAETDLRERLFAHLQRLHFAYHDTAQTGQLMARAATDIQQIEQFLTMIPLTISNIVTIVAITVILLMISWKLAILALVALPLVNVFAKRFAEQVHPASVALQAELADYATVVEETITGVRVVKGFGAEGIQTGALAERTARVQDRAVALGRIRARFNPILDFLPAVGLIAVLGYGGWLVIHHHLSIGELVAFNVYIAMLIGPLRMTGWIVAQAERAVASAQRIDDVISTAPAIADSPAACPLPEGRGAIRFEDVRFAYSPGAEPVLDGFSLDVVPGEAVALVGATGAGKTTVARLVPRFYDVDAGRVVLDGADVRDVRLTELRKAVGIVFEDTFLFSDTIRGNIAFAEPHVEQAQVERAARLAGAHDFIAGLPEGYDTVIGERGFSLSGGQRQRLALARAILADPRVLILDDATSSVDPTKEHEIRDALDEVMRGRTTIVIAHRPATIALADRVVLLDGGRVVAEGTHEHLIETSERYRTVLAQQAEALEHAGGERGA